MVGHTETALRFIPFWDYPNIGSLSRADGFTRAQTRQVGPFCRADGTLQSYDRGEKARRADAAGFGHEASQDPVVRCQIRGRRAANRCRGIRSDLSRDVRRARRNLEKAGETGLNR